MTNMKETAEEWVVNNFNTDEDIRNKIEAQEAEIKRLREALHQIATFEHLRTCSSRKWVPIYECNCILDRLDQWEIAQAALAEKR